ncbi:glycosyltransferase [Pontibacter burrus]|uniref:Glycosyltransferase n=1 Tax=Pontibacter burrus TaxID=2704466 RepID=A0A6B3LSS2_9BACT|nr:glycosyltransferase [Pontibacter burrus]NEM97266.1 glycosyltransferase [Pontibacter burrus]
MNKIKVYQLITSVNLGGAENVAFNIVQSNDARIEFTIVELYRSHNKYAISKRNELNQKGIQIKTLFPGPKKISLLFAPLMLFVFLVKDKPLVVHSHTDLPDFVLGLTLRLFGILRLKKPRIIRTIHNTKLWHTHNTIGKLTEAAFLNDHVIGVSLGALNAYKELRRNYRLLESSRLGIIYNGCDIPSNASLNFNFRRDKINIAFCGRFEYQKGVDILIKCIDSLKSNYSNKIDFYFIGDGSLRDDLFSLKNRQHNIFIHPPIENINNYLWAFDYVVMPSRFEGLGLISVEASYANVPVIATNVPGLNETLPHDWPLLYEPNDLSSLILLFERIVRQEFDLPLLKGSAFNFVTSRFEFKKMKDSYLQIYKQS